jgi:homoserine kinase
LDAGALGSSISGSGPSIFALCRNRAIADRVAAAMTEAVKKEIGGDSQTYVSTIASRGAHVIG